MKNGIWEAIRNSSKRSVLLVTKPKSNYELRLLSAICQLAILSYKSSLLVPSRQHKHHGFIRDVYPLLLDDYSLGHWL